MDPKTPTPTMPTNGSSGNGQRHQQQRRPSPPYGNGTPSPSPYGQAQQQQPQQQQPQQQQRPPDLITSPSQGSASTASASGSASAYTPSAASHSPYPQQTQQQPWSSPTPGGSAYATPRGAPGGFGSPTPTYSQQIPHSQQTPHGQQQSYFSPMTSPTPTPAASSSLRRRPGGHSASNPTAFTFDSYGAPPIKSPSSGGQTPRMRRAVKTLDMFPKVESDMVVRTEHGGIISLVGYGLIGMLVLAEIVTWGMGNGGTREHLVVDTSLGKRMRINLNITFPAIACEDVHVDAMDVAGDSQLDMDDTFVKRRLRPDGRRMDDEDLTTAANRAKERDDERQRLIKEAMEPNYCGPCYGAETEEKKCCNTCDELKDAYQAKRWGTGTLMLEAEQCIREGREAVQIKRMTKGEGCNLSGYMSVNRVAGNFHIAMGEGVERDGRHIHQFIPEDAPNFNASHIVHELSFGPKIPGLKEKGGLGGVKKFTTEENGSTGLFQYFLKVVPTIYKDEKSKTEPVLETNRFFFTERFRPLMTELDDEHHDLGSETQSEVKGAQAGGKLGGSQSHSDHHKVQNAVLPGVFFMYEIYPFAVEVTKTRVPLTHLVIRLMAVVGGLITITGWADSFLFAREKKGRGGKVR